MNVKSLTAGLLAGMVSLAAVQAQALTVTETGDFSDSTNVFSSTFTGSLSEGINTISGSILTSCVATTGAFSDCSSGDDADNFDWSIPDGLELDSASIAISNFAATGTLASSSLVFGFLGDAEWEGDGVFNLDINNDFFQFEQALIYVTTASEGSLQGVGDVGWDYTLTLNATASAVPIPAAAWLFGSALIGLVGLKRKGGTI